MVAPGAFLSLPEIDAELARQRAETAALAKVREERHARLRASYEAELRELNARFASIGYDACNDRQYLPNYLGSGLNGTPLAASVVNARSADAALKAEQQKVQDQIDQMHLEVSAACKAAAIAPSPFPF